MKKIIATLTLLFAIFSLPSCRTYAEITIDIDQIYYADIYGKWEFESYNTTFRSIEFTTNGYYFLELRESDEVVYGVYKKTDSKQFTLYGYGVIEISSTYSGTEQTNIIYKLTLDDGTIYPNQGGVLVDDEISDNTVYVSALWEVTGYKYQDIEITSGYDNTVQEDAETNVKYLFISNSGTFVSIYEDGSADSYVWVWGNTDETQLKINLKDNSFTTEPWNLEGVSTFDLEQTLMDSNSDDMTFQFNADALVWEWTEVDKKILDQEGNPVLDDDGNPTYEKDWEYVKVTKDTEYEMWLSVAGTISLE